MATNWTDPTLTTGIYIRTIHINELRSVVNQNRLAAGLASYAWTDSPVTAYVHIRAVHFTELRNAIQDLWNQAGMGTLPNWSVGNAPSTSRQVSLRDTTDLRTWLQDYENHIGQSVDPPRMINNGLHWCSPVLSSSQSEAEGVFNAGKGFAAALVLAKCGCSVLGVDGGGSNDWASACSWLTTPASGGGPTRAPEIVLRLYWPCANIGCTPGQAGTCNLPGTGPELGQALYTNIVKPAIQNYGISNFQVLNELDAEYEASCGGRAQLAGYMYNVAYWIKRSAYNDGLYPTHPIYLGFPGPSMSSGPTTGDWANYWDTYVPLITKGLGFVGDVAYNWLAVHAYPGLDGSSLQTNFVDAYKSLVVLIPNYPHRYTEWSIPNTDPTRIADMTQTLSYFRGYVTSYAGGGVDVYAMHAYIADPSDTGSGGNVYGLSATDAASITNVF